MLHGNTSKGMVWDTHSDVTAEQSYSFVFNGNLHSHSSEQSYPFISNNTSNIECVNFEKGYKVIGLISIKELNSSILALYNEESNYKLFIKIEYAKKDLGVGDSYTKSCKGIKIIENNSVTSECNYTELLYTNCFNWSLDNPLHFEYQITDTTLNLYFVNGYDQDRFLSFKLSDFSLDDDFKYRLNADDCDPEIVDALDCEKTLWYPHVEHVSISAEKIEGGSKLPGKYSYLFAYSTNKGIPLTPFIGLTLGTSIFNIGKKTTEYGIKITLDNVEKRSRYRYYTIVVVESVKGVTSYKQIGTYPISQTTVYDWDNNGSPIGLPVLMTQYPFYKYSRAITESNNILFKAGLSEFEKLNLQPIINQVEVEWVTTVVKEGHYKEDNNFMSFLRDEVYALGIQPVSDNLELWPVFPLINKSTGAATKTYTSSNPLNLLYQRVEAGEEVVYQAGKFGLYESTEKYPNNKEVWDQYCGQNIRLFKFPDHSLSTHYTSSNVFGEKVFIHPIGVRVTSDMNALFDQAVTDGLITQEQRNRIKGWKLVRSDRNGNNSIIGKGLLFDMWEYDRVDRDENFILYQGTSCSDLVDKEYFPNYPFNDLRPDPFLTNDSEWYTRESEKTIPDYPIHQEDKDKFNLKFIPTNRYTFHSPDTHFTNPNLGNKLKLEAECTGLTRGFFNQAQEQALQRILSWKHYDLAVALGKYIASLQDSPEKADVQQLGSNIGNTVGGAIGSVASAFGPIGSAVGGVLKAAGGLLGGLIGKKMYESNGWFQFIDASFKAGITYSETQKLLDIFASLIKAKQYHYQYQAVGEYNKIKPVSGERDIEEKEYLGNGKYIINNTKINNFNRESSVYLKLAGDLIDPIKDSEGELADTSKILLSEGQIFDDSKVIAIKDRIMCYNWGYRNVPDEYFYGCINNGCDPSCLDDPNGCVGCEYCFHDRDAYFWGELCRKEMLPYEKYPVNFETGDYPIGKFFYLDNDKNIITSPTFNTGKYAAIIEWDENGDKVIKVIAKLIIVIERGTDGISVNHLSETDCFRNVYIDNYSEYKDYGGIPTFAFNSTTSEGCDFHEEITYQKSSSPCECNRERYTSIASYYASIKRDIRNQYGTIYDITWLPTGSGVNRSMQPIFGGDTFIGRMTLKRKHSFFNLSLFNNPEDSEINYSLLGNAANPIFFFDKNPVKHVPVDDHSLGLTFPLNNVLNKDNRNYVLNFFKNRLFNIESQISVPKYKLDCSEDTSIIGYRNNLPLKSIEGYMYLYSYGIISFIAESNINLDLRDKGETLGEDFYPNQSDLSMWLQEKHVSPAMDNVYIYDRSYSKQAVEYPSYMYDINFKGNNEKILHSNRVIYSAQGSEINDDDYSDPFLINRALDYYDFSKKNGKLISIEGIEGDKVFVRQEHNSSVFGAYITLNSDQSTVLISSGSIFQNKPVEFATPNLGYFGSQHQAILNTPFGHITADSIRGQVFHLGNGGQNLTEISNKGMFSFFKEHLPFQISRYFKDVNIDNNFNGIGLSMVYDNRFQLFHLTKLDYVPLDPRITHNKGKFYLEDKEVSLKDSKYFCNISWTISYSFVEQRWYSFQPFTPNFYIEHIDYFDSGIDSGIWRHNITNKSYQKFYGKLYPFIVETWTKFDGLYHQVTNASFLLDVIQYMNKYDKIFKDNITFNKAIVSTDSQTSGLLELHPKSNNLYLESRYPIKHTDKTDIKISIKEGIHSFNQFRDIAKYKDIPLWIRPCNSYYEELNQDALDNTNKNLTVNTIAGNQVRLRLIQDKEDKYQFIFKGSYINDIIKRRN